MFIVRQLKPPDRYASKCSATRMTPGGPGLLTLEAGVGTGRFRMSAS